MINFKQCSKKSLKEGELGAKTYNNVQGLDENYINRIVDSILEAVPVERIYLFGSYARGQQTSESDIDLYVITSGNERPLKLGGRIRKHLLWMSHPRDVLCSDMSGYKSRIEDLSTIEHQVNKEGVLLYG